MLGGGGGAAPGGGGGGKSLSFLLLTMATWCESASTRMNATHAFDSTVALIKQPAVKCLNE